MERELTPMERFGWRVAKARYDEVEEQNDLQVARERLLSEIHTSKPRRRWWKAAGGGLAAAAAILLVVRFSFLRATPLGFHVGHPGHAGKVGAWLEAPDTSQLPVRFSDGTTVLLSPGARGRITDTHAHGAKFNLERGMAAVSVVTQPDARWSVDAGPFLLQVVGTRFDVTWDPAEEVFDLKLYNGSVRVTGPRMGDGRVVVAGEHLHVGLRTGRDGVGTSSATAAGASSGPPVESSARPAPSASAGQNVGAAPDSAPLQPTWREHLKKAKYKQALEAAQAEGFDGLCNSASAADVLGLGDAALYGGRSDLAQSAYLAVRKRFPGSGPAAQAAFSLGRLSVHQRGSYSGAVRWFNTYLSERPGGSLAREAMGRIIEAHVRMGNKKAAKTVAERYLKRYPGGPHAKLARKVTGK